MTKEELRNYYKIIERNKVNDDIEVIDLYNEERSNNRHIRLLFAYNKLYYTGDMGSYTFGGSICNVRAFFKGNYINPGYWQEKVEAYSEPLLCPEIDVDKAREAIIKEIEDCGDEVDEEEIDNGLYLWESNEYRAFDIMHDLFEKLGYEDLYEMTISAFRSCQEWSSRFLYACEVIQWVENKILED